MSALISACGNYRYLLTRELGPAPAVATFIMLNPSTADATEDDPTIRKCKGFATRWGCGTIRVVNLFACRTKSPAIIKAHPTPVGPANKRHFDDAIRFAKDRPGFIVCAWGVHGGHRDQDLVVLNWLAVHAVEPVCLGVTKDGHPLHPLLVAYSATLIPYSGRPAV
jgi:hypothetical protein